jgi:hypothetical protein
VSEQLEIAPGTRLRVVSHSTELLERYSDVFRLAEV